MIAPPRPPRLAPPSNAPVRGSPPPNRPPAASIVDELTSPSSFTPTPPGPDFAGPLSYTPPFPPTPASLRARPTDSDLPLVTDLLLHPAALPAWAAPPLALSAAALGAKALNFLWVALGLGLVIFFHELGHFAVAKWCGVKVERFSIGFGPVLLSKTRGETEYALSAFPLGGYVKMLGQDDIDPSQLTSEEIAEDPRSYSAKPVWQRMAIISAGVVMNLATAVLFFATAMWLGLSASAPVVGQGIAGGPAWTAGVGPGDRLTAVNGRPVREFVDVIRGVALNWGDEVRLEGVRRDGDVFDVTVAPEAGTRRTVGLTSARSLTLGEPFVAEATPAAGVEALKRGGTVVAAEALPASGDDGESVGDNAGESGGGMTPLDSFADYADFVAAHADRPIRFTLEVEADGERDGTPATETYTATVPPTPLRDFGFTVPVGEIAAIADGSPAAEAGLRRDDRLVRVAGREVGADVDPLDLPNLFYSLAVADPGAPVPVTVIRTEGGGGPVETALSVVPDPKPGWATRPTAEGEPLEIPALGLAYELNPTVTAVAPGGPAAKAGLRPNDRLLKVVFTPPRPSDDGGDGDEEAPDPLTVEFGDDAETAWGYAFATAQLLPTWRTTLTVERDGKRLKAKIEPAPSETRFFPVRGLLTVGDGFVKRAGGAGEALAMGSGAVRGSVEEMYLTLASLFTGRLSVKNLRGPLGIVGAGAEFAENGLATFCAFLGFLSVNLAVLNFLPIPVLDGGHMVWLTWEAVARRKPSERLVIAMTWVGLGLIVALMVTVLYLDVFEHRVLGG